MTTPPLPAVTTVVTHPGDAHLDDLMAVAVWLANFPQASVYRRDPTPAELADPTVVVVDVGLVADPERMNFDHHQYPRDYPPTCALTLTLDRLGLLAPARMAFPWLDLAEVFDSKGPVAAAKHVGMPVDRLHLTTSPVEGYVLRLLGRQSGAAGIHPNTPLHDFLVGMGRDTLDYATRFAARQELLSARAVVHLAPTEGGRHLEVVDVSFVSPEENPGFGLEAWVKANHPAAAVTVRRDDRGDGLALFRRNDHPRIDFSALEGTVGCVFAHKNGFVAKLAAGMNPLVAVQQALKPPPG